MKFKEIDIESAKFLSGFDVSLKRDGTQMTWKNGNLISKRDIVRNDRFEHIVKILKDNSFPDCVGELYIEKGNVFSITSSENWKRAVFMPFELLSKDDWKERQRKIDKLVTLINNQYLTKPIRFKSVEEGWAYANRNNEEGLVLKNGNLWYKIKRVGEADIRFTGYETHNKGITLTNTDGIRVTCNGEQSNEVKEAIDNNGFVDVTIRFQNMTDEGKYFQPRFAKMVI